LNNNVFSAGAVLIVLSIANLSPTKKFFGLPVFQYLGQISFALYLTHWPILALGGWEIVPYMQRLTGNVTTIRSELGVALGFICLAPIIIWAADLCWRYVDKPSIRFARWVEAELRLGNNM